MNKLKTKIRKAKYAIKHKFLSPNSLILTISIVICLCCTWGAISAMSRNWNLAEQVANKKREEALLALEVETLELENEYYRSDEYLELAARKYRNKKLPDETIIYLPANSEQAIHKYDEEAAIEVEDTSTPRSNFDQWMSFLFGAA